MALVVNATPGDPAANSYITVAEAQDYFDARLPVVGWDTGDQDVLVVMATRVLDSFLRAFRVYIPASGSTGAYYRVRRTWSGTPATTTQRLAWPRIGMFDGNGNAIPSNIIPQDLKDAVAELAGQLGNADRTLDNDIVAQGITSVRVGSVSLTFKDMIETRVLPDAVWNLMPSSWFTDELTIPAVTAEFDVIS